MAANMELSPTLAIHLHRTLGQQIVSGAFEGKPFPSEAELAKQFDTSRTVVREAMKMLTARGLINVRQRANRLNPMTAWNLLDPDVSQWLRQRPVAPEAYREYMQMRLGIEPVAAGLAATLRNPDTLKTVATALEALRDSATGPAERLDMTIRFHHALLLGSQNLFFARLTELVTTALHMETRLLGPESLSLSLPLRTQIHACLRHGDVAGAEAMMRELLRTTLRQAEDRAFAPD